MRLQIHTNGAAVAGMLQEAQRQARYAAAVALNRVSADIVRAERDEMRAVFDRPTRWTLNSLRTRGATKVDLVAEVYIGETTDSRQHYLVPEVHGGRRVHKRFEELLHRRGILYRDEIAVPGDAATLDAYGNIRSREIIRILSQLKAFNLSGFDANATNSRRSKAKRKTKRYFFARQRETRTGGGAWKSGEKVQHLPSGIYLEDRADKDGGGFLKPILMFVKRANYRPRFHFYDVAKRIVDERFPMHFEREFAKAMATARRPSR